VKETNDLEAAITTTDLPFHTSIIGPWMHLLRQASGPSISHALEVSVDGERGTLEQSSDTGAAVEPGVQLIGLPGSLPLPPCTALLSSAEPDPSVTTIVVDDASDEALAVLTSCDVLVSWLRTSCRSRPTPWSVADVDALLAERCCSCGVAHGDFRVLRLEPVAVARAESGSVFDTNDAWFTEEADLARPSFLLIDPASAPVPSRFLPLDYYLGEPCMIGA